MQNAQEVLNFRVAAAVHKRAVALVLANGGSKGAITLANKLGEEFVEATFRVEDIALHPHDVDLYAISLLKGNVREIDQELQELFRQSNWWERLLGRMLFFRKMKALSDLKKIVEGL